MEHLVDDLRRQRRTALAIIHDSKVDNILILKNHQRFKRLELDVQNALTHNEKQDKAVLRGFLPPEEGQPINEPLEQLLTFITHSLSQRPYKTLQMHI